MTPRAIALEKAVSFCRARSMTESRFGKLAVNDCRFISRLRDGSGVTLTVIEKAFAYIEAQDKETGRKSPAPTAAALAPASL